MKTILVYGWFGQGNIGDELFKDAFARLITNVNFVFTTRIDVMSLKGIDAVIFGGGSFVYAKPNITNDALKLLKSIPVFYVGIGVEGNAIDPIHQSIMSFAEGVFIRSTQSFDEVKKINQRASVVEDIVFSLVSDVKIAKSQQKTILVMPNIETVPRWNSPHWMHVAWEHFKDEFAQSLDMMIEDFGFSVAFLPSCKNESMDDTWPACEIISRMQRRKNCSIYDVPNSKVSDITEIISQHQVVVSQRYHGIVLSRLAQRPCVAISHHDKLRYAFPSPEQNVSFYEISKSSLVNAVMTAQEKHHAIYTQDEASANFSKITELIKKAI